MIRINQKPFDCPKKVEARQKTIIDVFTNLYSRKALPLGKQYWTICSQCYFDRLLENCEYDFIVNKAKLISSQQWYGVEINPEIHAVNKRIVVGNWINEDIEVAISNALVFNPGIINLDYTTRYDKTVTQLSRIMEMCTTEEVMIVYNTFVKGYSVKMSIEELVIGVQSNRSFAKVFHKDNWNIYPECIAYKGTGHTNSVMATLIFYKK